MSESLKAMIRAKKAKIQPSFDTSKMDTFIEQMYMQTSKSALLKFIQDYIGEHGEALINLRDSTGNCLIHHLCTLLDDEDVQVMTDIL